MCWDRIIEAEEPAKKAQVQPKAEPNKMPLEGQLKDVSTLLQPAPKPEAVPELIQAS